MRPIDFELCVEALAAALSARDGGAHRIELCSALGEGGLTPSHALIREVVRKSELPVHVMLRPRGGDFVYNEEEEALMCADLEHARQLGVSGFVLGLLHDDDTIDVERTRLLVKLAGPLEVTFHRAFDCTSDLPLALEAVIATGCRRLLTSGGMPTVEQGRDVLGQLVGQAGERIRVAVGGGLRLYHASEIARATGALSFHGSLRRRVPCSFPSSPGEAPADRWTVDAEAVRAMVEALSSGSRQRASAVLNGEGLEY